MPTTQQEMARRRIVAALRDAGIGDRAPERRPLSARYVASEAYQRTRGAVTVPSDARSTPIASTRELIEAMRLRTYTDLTVFSSEGVPHVAWLPLPAAVPQLVETVETTVDGVRLAAETSDVPGAGGGPPGTPLPEPAAAFPASVPVTPLERFGVAWPVSKGTLDDAGLVQSMLERRLALEFTFGLEDLIVAAPAGGPNGTGILATPGLPSVAKGGTDSYRLDTILRAVATVQGAGFYTASPLSVIANPTTLEVIRAEKDPTTGLYIFKAHLVPEVDAWVPSTQVPPGTAIVGDVFDAVALFVKDGLAVELAPEHGDLFVRDLIEMMLATRALVWVRNPTALCLATGL